jgi:hypothetical protein
MQVWKDGVKQAGAPAPHGTTHAFQGTDTIPGGEEIEAVFTCTATELIREAVYLTSTGEVRQSDASDQNKMPVHGVIKSKPSSTTCILVKLGEVDGYSGLTPDTYLFASAIVPGALSTSPPTGVGDVRQIVADVLTSSKINVKIRKGVIKGG